jgi:viologen exporter family transport system permease protein
VPEALARRPAAGRWRSLAEVYRTRAGTSVQLALQYRFNLVFDLVLSTVEPIVYLAVWRLVAESAGGAVNGFTPGRFAAYYITYGFVRLCLQAGAPSNWQEWVQRGELSGYLLLPVHPAHVDLATWLGFCLTRAVCWLPVGALLVVVYRPELDTSPLQVIVFVVSLVPALVMRTVMNDIVGMTSFWLVSIVAIGGVTRIVEMLFSGRLVPPEVLPSWAQTLSHVLPFEWGFAFPIEALIGPITPGELGRGLLIQLAWTAALWGSMLVVWRRGVRRYGAVSG